MILILCFNYLKVKSFATHYFMYKEFIQYYFYIIRFYIIYKSETI